MEADIRPSEIVVLNPCDLKICDRWRRENCRDPLKISWSKSIGPHGDKKKSPMFEGVELPKQSQTCNSNQSRNQNHTKFYLVSVLVDTCGYQWYYFYWPMNDLTMCMFIWLKLPPWSFLYSPLQSWISPM